MVSLPVLLVRVMVLVMDFDVHLTTGRSVGRQAPTIPTQISTPDHIAAGASTSGIGFRNCRKRVLGVVRGCTYSWRLGSQDACEGHARYLRRRRWLKDLSVEFVESKLERDSQTTCKEDPHQL